MLRTALAVLLHLGSIAALAASAMLIHHLLLAYPTDHFATSGSTMPAVSRTHMRWLPFAPAGLGIAALASVAAGVYLWRGAVPPERRRYLALVASAFGYFLASFCVTALLVAYFLLPKLASST